MTTAITVKLQNEEKDICIKLDGVSKEVAKETLRQVFDDFLASFDKVSTQIPTETPIPSPIHVIIDEEGKVEDLSNGAYANVNAEDFVKVNCTETNETNVDKNNEIDYETEFNNTDTEKYNREYPKLKTPMARNMYNKLSELQINQKSYLVTDKGELKLQAKYSCKCGNFMKHWVAYPDGKKTVSCSNCYKRLTLVFVDKSNFPSTDKFGNFYVTSDMLKRAEQKELSEQDTYIKVF